MVCLVSVVINESILLKVLRPYHQLFTIFALIIWFPVYKQSILENQVNYGGGGGGGEGI